MTELSQVPPERSICQVNRSGMTVVSHPRGQDPARVGDEGRRRRQGRVICGASARASFKITYRSSDLGQGTMLLETPEQLRAIAPAKRGDVRATGEAGKSAELLARQCARCGAIDSRSVLESVDDHRRIGDGGDVFTRWRCQAWLNFRPILPLESTRRRLVRNVDAVQAIRWAAAPKVLDQDACHVCSTAILTSVHGVAGDSLVTGRARHTLTAYNNVPILL